MRESKQLQLFAIAEPGMGRLSRDWVGEHGNLTETGRLSRYIYIYIHTLHVVLAYNYSAIHQWHHRQF